MRIFSYLREQEWYPEFAWMATPLLAADRINRPHEDYPARVKKTSQAIHSLRELSLAFPFISNEMLLMIHLRVFRDKHFAGKWREVQVRVGPHHPPAPLFVPFAMAELEKEPAAENLEKLLDWYNDFETIHPFQDGNGRVGGIVVAAFSHRLAPQRGWLTAVQ